MEGRTIAGARPARNPYCRRCGGTLLRLAVPALDRERRIVIPRFDIEMRPAKKNVVVYVCRSCGRVVEVRQ